MNPQQRLQLFVRRADELAQTTCLAHADQWGFELSFDGTARTTKWSVTGPSEDETLVLVTRLRPMLLRKDELRLERVYDTCHLHVRSDELRGRLTEARAAWRQFLRDGRFRLEVDERRYTPEFVMDVLINGWLFHTDLEKLAILDAMLPHVRIMSKHVFNEALLESVRQVLYVAHVSRIALQHDLVDDKAAA